MGPSPFSDRGAEHTEQMATGLRPPSTQSWRRRNAFVIAAVGIVIAGSLVFVVAPTTVPAYGWTAYTPLSSGPDYSRTSYLTDQHLVGAALAVLGLIALAGAVGFRLGLRRRTV